MLVTVRNVQTEKKQHKPDDMVAVSTPVLDVAEQLLFQRRARRRDDRPHTLTHRAHVLVPSAHRKFEKLTHNALNRRDQSLKQMAALARHDGGKHPRLCLGDPQVRQALPCLAPRNERRGGARVAVIGGLVEQIKHLADRV